MPLVTTRASVAYGAGFGKILDVGGFTPTGSYDALASFTVPSGGVSEIVFAGLPTGGQYQHLQLRITAASATNQSAYNMTINSDTNNANYRYHLSGGAGSDGLASQTTNNRNMGILRNNTYFSTAIVDMLDFSNTNKYKTYRVLSGVDQSSAGFVGFSSNLWMNTNAITRITLTENSATNFLQHSQFSLYGIRG
jgi:hypothetical protein